jgi:Flp pilus assembly protein TadD
MDRREHLDRYMALGAEDDFVEAKRLYELALADGADAELLADYGFLLECHGRNELRRAVAQYERAIELDPDYDKAHYQLIGARAGLREPDLAVDAYEQRLAASPGGVREHRFLAQAYLNAHAYARARDVVAAGLDLAPDDAPLIASRGEAKAGLGDPDGALADWGLALELDPADIGALYSTAFQLERAGRLGEAAQTWAAIVDWNEARGLALEAEWPKQELRRLRAAIAGTTNRSAGGGG